MSDIDKAMKKLSFKWLPKHLNHIAENIVLKRRNISFLAINALFRNKDVELIPAEPPFKDSFIIKGFVDFQPNDKLRLKAEDLSVIFRLDEYQNIIVITAYSESDE